MISNAVIYGICIFIIILTNIYIQYAVEEDQQPAQCCSRIKSSTIGIIATSLAVIGLLCSILVEQSEDGPPLFFLTFPIGSIVGLCAYTWNQRDFTKNFLSEKLSTVFPAGGQVAPIDPPGQFELQRLSVDNLREVFPDEEISECP